MSSPRAAHASQKIDIRSLPRLGVRAPDLPLVRIVIEAVDIVIEVGDQSVSGNVALSGRRQDFVEFLGSEVELIQLVRVIRIGTAIGLGPQFPVDVRMRSEERRVRKECRCRRGAVSEKKKMSVYGESVT